MESQGTDKVVVDLGKSSEREKFLAHNFRLIDGRLEVAPLDEMAVAEAFRFPSHRDPELIPTLEETLRPAVCAKYLTATVFAEITNRDYYISKLNQILIVTQMGAHADQDCQQVADCFWEELVQAFHSVPDSNLERLAAVDWRRVFRDYSGCKLDGLPARLLLEYAQGPLVQPVRRGSTTRKAFLKAKLKEVGLTQVGLAEKSGVSIGSLRGFINGRSIHIESVVAIAGALKCSCDDLIRPGPAQPHKYAQ
jgi:hypothetical protein